MLAGATSFKINPRQGWANAGRSAHRCIAGSDPPSALLPPSLPMVDAPARTPSSGHQMPGVSGRMQYPHRVPRLDPYVRPAANIIEPAAAAGGSNLAEQQTTHGRSA